jgi:hypothetical protein
MKTNLHNNTRAVFCAENAEGLYKRQRKSFEPVESQGASLPGHELESTGLELKN